MGKLKLFLMHFILKMLNSQHVISSDSASPTIYYQFCTAETLSGRDLGEERNLTKCGPETFGSNSWFEFGNTSQNVLDLEERFGTNDFLQLKCNASYPILWLAASTSMSGITLNPNEESNGYGRNPLEIKTVTYSQHVSVRLRLLDSHHVLRCASFSHPNQAAEIFLKVGKFLLQPSVAKGLKIFAVDFVGGEQVKDPMTSLTVPCVSDIDDYDNFTMSKLGRRDLEHVLEYSPKNTSYDHRIGFRINEKEDPRFIYRCNSPLRKEIIFPVTLSTKLVADLHYSNGQDGITGFYCSPGNETIFMQVHAISPCQSVVECRFLWGPLPPLWTRQQPNHGDIPVEEIFKSLVMAKPSLTGKVPAYNHGNIECGGRIWKNGDGDNTYSYLEVDQWFTGLDNLKYTFSKSFPIDSVIRLSSSGGKHATENSLRHFRCEISTFVLLPNIQFVVEYSSGQKLVSLQSTLPPGSVISKLAPDKKRATVVWVLELELSVDITKITCYAPWVNSSQWAHAEVPLHVKAEAGPNAGTSGGVVGISLAGASIVILVLSLAFLWRKYKSALKQTLTKDEVNEFHLGSKQKGSDENMLMENMPFNSAMKIPRSSLEIDVDYFRAFLKEIKVMAYIGEHENIVQFFGAVVEKLEERECFGVTEWSSHGNLNCFLRKCLVEENEALQTQNCKRVPGKSINQSVLLNMCTQIANGMDFLSQRKVIHGDLATRNVLVFDGNVVKITDFGLSRKLYSCSNYVKKQQAPLPWRWMSLESLRYLEFSTQSDVWSFGVTVWEIFTMAQVPFSGTTWSNEFVDQVESGYRLPKPPLAPQAVFEWMMRCWENNPDQRPKFRDCAEFFASFSRKLELAADDCPSTSYIRRWKTESVPADFEFSCEVFSKISENLGENL